MLVGKRPTLFFFWGGGFELFTVKFASKAVEYPVSITCGVESAQLSQCYYTVVHGGHDLTRVTCPARGRRQEQGPAEPHCPPQ